MSICDGHSRTRRVLGAVIGTAGWRWQPPLREVVGGGSSNVCRRVGLRNRSKSLDARVSCFFTVQPRRILVCPKVYPSPRTAATVLRSFYCGVSLDGYFAGVGQMTNRLAPFVFPANVRLLGNA
jgi:hypothetical protein